MKPARRGPSGCIKSIPPTITPARFAPNVTCRTNPTKSHEREYQSPQRPEKSGWNRRRPSGAARRRAPARRRCRMYWSLPRRPEVTIRPNTNGSWRWTWTGASAAACAWRLARRRTAFRKIIFAPGSSAMSITRPKADSGESRGETFVDSPNGGIGGFKPSPDSQGGHPQIVFCAQAVQSMRELALLAGLSGGRHL